jgi:hypothetical protein
MNDIEKALPKKRPGRWALEAIVPAILISVAMMLMVNGLDQLYHQPGPAIVHMIAAAFVTYAAIFFLMARLSRIFSP